MSSYQQKSGAQKRREKKERDKETRTGALTLTFDVGVKKRTETEKESSGLENEQTGPQPTGSAWPELSDKPD